MSQINELYHYGVLGMKWGRRRSKYAKNYTKKDRAKDLETYGKKGVKRINKDVKKGYTLEAARSRESSAKRHLGIEYRKKVATNIAYGAGAAAASVAMAKLVKNGKLTTENATRIGSTIYKGKKVVDFYNTLKIGNLAAKTVFGLDAKKGKDYV